MARKNNISDHTENESSEARVEQLLLARAELRRVLARGPRPEPELAQDDRADEIQSAVTALRHLYARGKRKGASRADVPASVWAVLEKLRSRG